MDLQAPYGLADVHPESEFGEKYSAQELFRKCTSHGKNKYTKYRPQSYQDFCISEIDMRELLKDIKILSKTDRPSDIQGTYEGREVKGIQNILDLYYEKFKLPEAKQHEEPDVPDVEADDIPKSDVADVEADDIPESVEEDGENPIICHLQSTLESAEAKEAIEAVVQTLHLIQKHVLLIQKHVQEQSQAPPGALFSF